MIPLDHKHSLRNKKSRSFPLDPYRFALKHFSMQTSVAWSFTAYSQPILGFITAGISTISSSAIETITGKVTHN
jgi:hypothetical protein